MGKLRKNYILFNFVMCRFDDLRFLRFHLRKDHTSRRYHHLNNLRINISTKAILSHSKASNFVAASGCCVAGDWRCSLADYENQHLYALIHICKFCSVEWCGRIRLQYVYEVPTHF